MPCAASPSRHLAPFTNFPYGAVLTLHSSETPARTQCTFKSKKQLTGSCADVALFLKPLTGCIHRAACTGALMLNIKHALTTKGEKIGNVLH